MIHAESRIRSAARTAAVATALVGLLAAGAAFGQRTITAITGSLESSTPLVRLPGVASGTLAASECANGCPIYRLRFDASTQYFIGKAAVPYAKFREAASKGDQSLFITYRLSDQTLTRLRILAVAAQ